MHCLDCDGTESTLDDIGINVPGPHGGRVHISHNGVYIEGSDNEVVSIDSNGVVIRKNGKLKTIKKGDFHISVDGDEDWK